MIFELPAAFLSFPSNHLLFAEEVREVTGQKEIIDGLLGGRVEIDYETGNIGSVTGGQRLTNLANLSSSWKLNAFSSEVDAAKVLNDFPGIFDFSASEAKILLFIFGLFSIKFRLRLIQLCYT